MVQNEDDSGIQEGRGWQVVQEAWETLGLSHFKI